MRFLVINDEADIIASLRDNHEVCYSDKDVVFAECHSVQEALSAIAEHKPDVVFLDHSFSYGGNEGFEVVDKAKDVKIYSTTGNITVWQEYEQRGIEVIKLRDLEELVEKLSAVA